MLYKKLIKLGLSSDEAKIYVASLELGETTISRISKKSKINRTTIYGIIKSLQEKGLINKIKKQKKYYYYAEEPKIFSRQLSEKELLLKAITPELLSIANVIDRKPNIQYFEESEGIKEIFKDMLNYPKSEILAWLTEDYKLFDKDFVDNYFVPMRIKNKISNRIIVPNNATMKNFKKNDQSTLRQTKVVNDENFAIKSSINLYGKNKIGIISFSEKIGLLIESEKIYTTLKSIFELAWKKI